MSRIGMPTKSDSYLIRYFCPYEDLNDCQPDPKHGIDLYNLPPSNGDPRRPCRSGFESSPKTPVRSGSDVLISWAGNGYVANGQSDGSCVKVMLAQFQDDPSIDDFVEIPGAECLDYWILNSKGEPDSEGTITIPDVAPGIYTLFWSWNFTEFWYSSCANIHVLPDGEGTRTPTKSPVRDGPGQADIDDYLNNGFSDLQDSDDFCERYSGLGKTHFAKKTSRIRVEGPLVQDWIGLCLSLVPNVHLHLDRLVAQLPSLSMMTFPMVSTLTNGSKPIRVGVV